ncbi:HEPN domain-containing protein [Acinetobacter radioresistens]|jgi:Apea-like HEPN|uniref:HEPN domain-containing protein n=1 Tax=Acinetobacter radioresistens TaxID=40216 RepID=UPI0020044A0D|nr:HEPN domain-containing protein [Acinetobacter radioresistens]MCK4086625.1 hypothetical protein [Acinetobacter radioresistens]MCX0329675.1 HEPN domain-containing protein [Acinetobacter radioresistens]
MLVLEEVFREKKAEYPEHFNLRMQRSISWLKQSIDLNENPELKILSLWISLQALYVTSKINQISHQEELCLFLKSLLQYDVEGKLERTLWGRLYPPIQTYLMSQYSRQSYWQYRHGQLTQPEWQMQDLQEQQNCEQIFRHKDTAALLEIVFARLITLHTQILQGGITCKSQLQAELNELASRILTTLLPVLILIMLEHGECFSHSQQPFYPQVAVC